MRKAPFTLKRPRATTNNTRKMKKWAKMKMAGVLVIKTRMSTLAVSSST